MNRELAVEPVGGWGTEVVRRPGQIPFLVYRNRPRSVQELFEAGRRWNTRDHLVQERRFTFEDVESLTEANAAVLMARGVQPGDRVMLLGGNSCEWVIAFWSITRAQAVVVLGNAWWNGDEIRDAIALSSPALVIADSALVSRIPPGYRMALLEEFGVVDRQRSSQDIGAPQYPVNEDDAAIVLFTSGSTGAPKGAVLSHRACVALQQTLLHRTHRLPHEIAEDFPRDVNLQTGPLFHIGGVQGLFRSWLLGATMVFPSGRFDPLEIVELIETEKIRRWGAVPTMVSRVLNVEGIDSRDLSSLRSLTIGGSNVSTELLSRARETFSNASNGVTQIYGLSEAGGTLTMASAADIRERPGTVGQPLPIVELWIDHPDNEGVGEIVARSSAQMSGYLGDDSSEMLTTDGMLHTGDLGSLDSDGYLFLKGRKKDLIIRGGENISPVHVEQILMRHDAVVECAVVGLPDTDLGEVVAAVVVLDPAKVVTSAELADWSRSRLAHFESPTRWWIRASKLPVNAAGKVDKVHLQRVFPVVDLEAFPAASK